MLTFLRKIRRSLIESSPAIASAKVGGSARKYLLYAIGEIALVVIGILIALQINNWNTEKREYKELSGFLSNISKNIKDDILEAEEMKIFRDSVSIFSKNLIEAARQSSITKEQFLDTWYFGKFHFFYDIYFHSNQDGFEALKNSGYLSKIQGEPVESKIYEFYSIVSLIEQQEESYNGFIENMEAMAFEDKVVQQLEDLRNGLFQPSPDFSKESRLILDLFNHRGINGAAYRGASGEYQSELLQDLIVKGEEIISLIDSN